MNTQSASLTVGGFCRQLLAHNPFYPLSAVLLLLGIHLLSTDPHFLPSEAPNLLFNFCALHFYELLAVATAVLLVKRRIVYDATLLAGLDLLLAIAPFILITQAVLIGRTLALTLSLVTAALVLMRIASLKRFFPELPLARSLLLLGGLLLLVNTLLPFLYRPVMEQDVADWARPSRWAWHLGLPLLQLSSLLLKPSPNARQQWVPFLVFQTWLIATAVHLRCVDYICDLPLQPALLAPLVWTAVWTLVAKAPSLTGRFWPCWPTLALIPAFGSSDPYLLTALSALNAMLLIGLAKKSPLAAPSAWISLIVSAFSLPEPLMPWLELAPTAASSPPHWLAGTALAVAGCGLMSRRLFPALLGACAMELAPWGLSLQQPVNYGLQLGFAYLLLHGLLWSHRPARPTLILQAALALLIVLHGFAWVYYAPAPAVPFLLCEGLLLCVACAIVYWRTGRIAPWRLALPGPLLVTAPLTPHVERFLHASPKGLLLLAISFLVFALGTLVAVRKKPF